MAMPGTFIGHKPKPARITQTGAAPRRGVGPSRAVKPRATKSETNESETAKPPKSKEIGGPSGPEPTRYGDWERKGICVDF